MAVSSGTRLTCLSHSVIVGWSSRSNMSATLTTVFNFVMWYSLGQHSIRCNQTSVTMRLGTGLSRTEFAFLTRPRAASRATDGPHLFESRLLGLHRCGLCGNLQKKSGQFCTGISDT